MKRGWHSLNWSHSCRRTVNYSQQAPAYPDVRPEESQPIRLCIAAFTARCRTASLFPLISSASSDETVAMLLRPPHSMADRFFRTMNLHRQRALMRGSASLSRPQKGHVVGAAAKIHKLGDTARQAGTPGACTPGARSRKNCGPVRRSDAAPSADATELERRRAYPRRLRPPRRW